MATIKIKRVCDPVSKADGLRVLIDRLWPRGFTVQALHADAWMKQLAPSPSLRIWYKHHPQEWTVFRRSYLLELKVNIKPGMLDDSFNNQKMITLLYASKDTLHNHAVLLQQFLRDLQKRSSHRKKLQPAGQH